MTLQNERTTDWQSKDVHDVFWALDYIPQSMWDSEILGIYRMSRSKDHPNPGIYWENRVVLYDPAFQNEEYTARALAHELAHVSCNQSKNEFAADCTTLQ